VCLPARSFAFAKDFASSFCNSSGIAAPTRRLDLASDPDDNMFIECADAARADYLITGNLKHFPRFWKNTKIITSREFVSLAAPHLIK